MSQVPLDIRPDPLPLMPTGRRAIIDPDAPALSGDYNDDDGRALDEAFEAAESGPQEYFQVGTDREDLPRATRIITRGFPFTNGSPPIQAFPIDLKRKNFTICATVDGVEYFMFGSDANDVESYIRLNGSAAAVGYTNGPAAPITISDHTGAIWVAGTGDMFITVTVVTE